MHCVLVESVFLYLLDFLLMVWYPNGNIVFVKAHCQMRDILLSWDDLFAMFL